MSTTLREYLQYLSQLLSGFRSSGEKQIAAERNQDIASYLRANGSLRVLDLGNGSLRPQYTLLQTSGHMAYGIDLVNRPCWNAFNGAYAIARAVYRWRLGVPIKDDFKRLICGNVGELPFPAGSFELITSVAAFEHFLDVSGVVAEAARVLKPGGLIYARIHLFASPSGGHNVKITEIPLRRLRF